MQYVVNIDFLNSSLQTGLNLISSEPEIKEEIIFGSKVNQMPHPTVGAKCPIEAVLKFKFRFDL